MITKFPKVTSVLISHDSKTSDYEYTLFTLVDGKRTPMILARYPESEVDQETLAPTAQPEDLEYLGGFDGETFYWDALGEHVADELERILNK